MATCSGPPLTRFDRPSSAAPSLQRHHLQHIFVHQFCDIRQLWVQRLGTLKVILHARYVLQASALLPEPRSDSPRIDMERLYYLVQVVVVRRTVTKRVEALRRQGTLGIRRPCRRQEAACIQAETVDEDGPAILNRLKCDGVVLWLHGLGIIANPPSGGYFHVSLLKYKSRNAGSVVAPN